MVKSEILTPRTRKIISVAMLKADRPDAEIAKIVGCREHIVRYTLNDALKSGLLTRRTIINMYHLGYFPVCVYFSCTLKKKQREKLVQFLTNHPNVSHLMELCGEYDFTIDLCVRSLAEARAILSEVSDKFGSYYRRRTISTLISIADFPIQRFDDELRKIPPLTIRDEGKRVEFDELDFRILCKLSRGDGKSEKELAHSLNIPLSTVSFRIKKLKQSGVIVGTRYIPNLAGLGFQTFKCNVKLADDRREIYDALFAFCREHGDVAYCLESFGGPDFKFGITVESANQLAEHLSELHSKIPGAILDIKILAQVKLFKSSFFPFHEDSVLEHVEK